MNKEAAALRRLTSRQASSGLQHVTLETRAALDAFRGSPRSQGLRPRAPLAGRFHNPARQQRLLVKCAHEADARSRDFRYLIFRVALQVRRAAAEKLHRGVDLGVVIPGRIGGQQGARDDIAEVERDDRA